jgi:hypothetical protein
VLNSFQIPDWFSAMSWTQSGHKQVCGGRVGEGLNIPDLL